MKTFIYGKELKKKQTHNTTRKTYNTRYNTQNEQIILSFVSCKNFIKVMLKFE